MKTTAYLAAAAVLSLAAAPALAADLPAAPRSVTAQAAPAAPAQAAEGVNINDIRAWLVSLGAEATEVDRSGDQPFLRVQDGGLTWGIFFYGCQGDVCPDMQFTALFPAGETTVERINAWNTNSRFLKAFHIAAQGEDPATVAVQYDVLLENGRPADQLREPTVVWISLLREFAVHVGFATATAPAAAAPATP